MIRELHANDGARPDRCTCGEEQPKRLLALLRRAHDRRRYGCRGNFALDARLADALGNARVTLGILRDLRETLGERLGELVVTSRLRDLLNDALEIMRFVAA